ncbi:MAG: type I-F CRISPR-associated protein Csy2 [Methylococcus sp.]
MTDTPHTPAGLLVLPRLRVQNANAISSPLTWGFPAPTAFLGFAHALERRLRADYDRAVTGIGIVCHDFQALTAQPNRRAHVVFSQSRNPVYLKKDAAKFIADGTPAAIIEEGRIHLTLTLVLAIDRGFLDEQDGEDFAKAAGDIVQTMRLAGGSLLPPATDRAGPPWHQPHWLTWPDILTEQARLFRRLRRQWLPGFVLVHRPDRLAEGWAALKAREPTATLLDALLDLTGLNHVPPTESGGDWSIERRSGWRVPVPIGYAGISELHPPGAVAAARDATVPFRFVESLYSLGEWVSPLRLPGLDALLWQAETDAEAGLYRCNNRYSRYLNDLSLPKETDHG